MKMVTLGCGSLRSEANTTSQYEVGKYSKDLQIRAFDMYCAAVFSSMQRATPLIGKEAEE
jgi:hypothetical protein